MAVSGSLVGKTLNRVNVAVSWGQLSPFRACMMPPLNGLPGLDAECSRAKARPHSWLPAEAFATHSAATHQPYCFCSREVLAPLPGAHRL